jgi:hypothetical protein
LRTVNPAVPPRIQNLAGSWGVDIEAGAGAGIGAEATEGWGGVIGAGELTAGVALFSESLPEDFFDFSLFWASDFFPAVLKFRSVWPDKGRGIAKAHKKITGRCLTPRINKLK